MSQKGQVIQEPNDAFINDFLKYLEESNKMKTQEEYERQLRVNEERELKQQQEIKYQQIMQQTQEMRNNEKIQEQQKEEE